MRHCREETLRKTRGSSPFCVRIWSRVGRRQNGERKRCSNRSGEETIRIVGLAELPSSNNGTACPSGVIASIVARPCDFAVPIIDLGQSLIICRPMDNLYGYACRLSFYVSIYRRIDYPHVNAKESAVYRFSAKIVCDLVPRR